MELEPPVRTRPEDYHYHVYNWIGSEFPWALSPAQLTRNDYQFYGMVREERANQPYRR